MLLKLMRASTLFLLTSFVVHVAAGPAAAALKRKSRAKKAAAAGQPLVFRSTGMAGAGRKMRQRDRTITFRRAGHRVAVSIQDHVANEVVDGIVELGPDRELVTEDPALINATNIFAVTPNVLRMLRAGGGAVVTTGQVEANGKVYDVEMEHSLDGPSTVRTQTTSSNGKLQLETVSRVDADGVPYSAVTSGRLRVFVFTAEIHNKLERVSGGRI